VGILKGVAGGLGAVAIGALATALFLVVVIGGGVYRTDCVRDNGVRTQTWGLGGDIPYLWSSGDPQCRSHTLTRYVLGKVGVMGDIDK
jgi:hypothetical protein